MSDFDQLNDSEIRHISRAIHAHLLEHQEQPKRSAGERQIFAKQRDRVNSEDAKLLMQQFLTEFKAQGQISESLIAHVASCFSVFFEHGRSLDHAFGVKSSRPGRPPNRESADMRIGVRIISLLLDGSNLTLAVREVANAAHKDERGIETIWRAVKDEAITEIRLQRMLEGKSFSEFEKSVLRRLNEKIHL